MVINSDLQSFTALYYRGVAHDEAGDRNAALADLNEAIRLNPNYVPAIYSRGVVFGEMGDLEKAIANYDIVLRLQPTHYLALNNRGAAWKKKRDADRAIADFTEAFRINPKYLIALFNRDRPFNNPWAGGTPYRAGCEADLEGQAAEGLYKGRPEDVERNAVSAA